MTYEDCLRRAAAELEEAHQLIQDEIVNYPTPISGCDAQFNHLLGLRRSINDALRGLQVPAFIPTPRMPTPESRVESR